MKKKLLTYVLMSLCIEELSDSLFMHMEARVDKENYEKLESDGAYRLFHRAVWFLLAPVIFLGSILDVLCNVVNFIKEKVKGS